jgi:hypothetical protein
MHLNQFIWVLGDPGRSPSSPVEGHESGVGTVFIASAAAPHPPVEGHESEVGTAFIASA